MSVTTRTKVQRGVGYCKNANCEDHHKGVFLLNQLSDFFCPVCRYPGWIVAEAGTPEGASSVFREVRVEYDYDPDRREYRCLAIVKDTSLDATHNTYRLRSPLIKTQKRALVVAESILGNLNQCRSGADEAGVSREFVISWDDPEPKYHRDLGEMAERLKKGGLGVVG